MHLSFASNEDELGLDRANAGETSLVKPCVGIVIWVDISASLGRIRHALQSWKALELAGEREASGAGKQDDGLAVHGRGKIVGGDAASATGSRSGNPESQGLAREVG